MPSLFAPVAVSLKVVVPVVLVNPVKSWVKFVKAVEDGVIVCAVVNPLPLL